MWRMPPGTDVRRVLVDYITLIGGTILLLNEGLNGAARVEVMLFYLGLICAPTTVNALQNRGGTGSHSQLPPSPPSSPSTSSSSGPGGPRGDA